MDALSLIQMCRKYGLEGKVLLEFVTNQLAIEDKDEKLNALKEWSKIKNGKLQKKRRI